VCLGRFHAVGIDKLAADSQRFLPMLMTKNFQKQAKLVDANSPQRMWTGNGGLSWFLRICRQRDGLTWGRSAVRWTLALVDWWLRPIYDPDKAWVWLAKQQGNSSALKRKNDSMRIGFQKNQWKVWSPDLNVCTMDWGRAESHMERSIVLDILTEAVLQWSNSNWCHKRWAIIDCISIWPIGKRCDGKQNSEGNR